MTNDKFIEKCLKKFSEHIVGQLKDAKDITIVSDEAPNRIFFKYCDKQNKRKDEGCVEFHVYL